LTIGAVRRNFSPGSGIGKYIHMAPNASQSLLALLFAGTVLAQQGGPVVPDWQVAAGGKMEFEIASVKPSPQGEFRPPNFPLDNGDSFINLGNGELPRGRFSARFPLIVYITFAYKIWPSPEQRRAMLAHLPNWVTTDSFDIAARAPMSNVTKDQMRLMMQSLLAERFHLAAHFEMQTLSVLALVVAKPGRLGPDLRSHEKGPPCNWPAGNRPEDKNVFPAVCDAYVAIIQPNGMMRVGSRNTTMELMASAIQGEAGRPVVDHTGLLGRFDFKLEWMHETNGAAPAGGPTPAAPSPVDSQPPGPTFFQALNDELGLKLEATKAPVPVLVIDHVERPSEN
jgi:bla regulator protein BlaR1